MPLLVVPANTQTFAPAFAARPPVPKARAVSSTRRHRRRAWLPATVALAALVVLVIAVVGEAWHAAALERALRQERRTSGEARQALLHQVDDASARSTALEGDLGAAEDEAARLYDVVRAMRTLGEQLRMRVGLNEPAIEPLPELPPPLVRRATGQSDAAPPANQTVVPIVAGPEDLAGGPVGATVIKTLPADTGPWPANLAELRTQPPATTGPLRVVVASEAITRQWDAWQQLAQAVDGALAQRSRAARPSIHPVYGPLTSGFGRRAGFWGALAFHTGYDISVRVGTPVAVTANGTVVLAGTQSGYGVTVEVQHADGLLTLYGHLSQILVRPGQVVSQGQFVALSGNTGISTGPHLHYEIRLNGTPVDPGRYW